MEDLQTAIAIKLEYFALFRTCTKKSEESLQLESDDPVTLYDQLNQRYRFPITRDRIHLVVNDEYSPWDKPLKEGDTVVFIPPVSGG
jgi:molybdopterin converting factor small subunit